MKLFDLIVRIADKRKKSSDELKAELCESAVRSGICPGNCYECAWGHSRYSTLRDLREVKHE